jgi:hypothetical protein
VNDAASFSPRPNDKLPKKNHDQMTAAEPAGFIENLDSGSIGRFASAAIAG